MYDFEYFVNNYFNDKYNNKKEDVKIIHNHHESKFKSLNINWDKISHEPIKTGYMKSDVNREVKVYVF